MPRSNYDLTAEYVIVLTGRELRGRLMGHDIYRATDFDILPLNSNISVSNPPHPAEGHLLALVRSHLLGGHFLFSYGWDITRRLQAQWENRGKDAHQGFWEAVRVLVPSLQSCSDPCFRRTTGSFGIGESRTVGEKHQIDPRRFLQSRLIDTTIANPKQDASHRVI